MITTTTKKFWTFLIFIFYTLFRKKRFRKYLIFPLLILVAGFLLPDDQIIPVKGATTKDWDENSFWAYPWGSSITHKGIDIFKARGTDVLSSTYGWVMYTAETAKGGKCVMVLGPKWRFHYYAHLESIDTYTLKPLKKGEKIGTVGDSGNAKGKPTHLHYGITSPFPYFWLFDAEAIQGERKMFHLDPDVWLRK